MVNFIKLLCEKNLLREFGGCQEAFQRRYYAEAVAWAEQNGYLGGYGNGFFGPEDMMSVEQAMVMIYRLFGSPKVTDADILDRYQDGDQVSLWARDAVAFAISNKLLEPDWKILPQSPISVKALRYAIGQIGMAD